MVQVPGRGDGPEAAPAGATPLPLALISVGAGLDLRKLRTDVPATAAIAGITLLVY